MTVAQHHPGVSEHVGLLEPAAPARAPRRWTGPVRAVLLVLCGAAVGLWRTRDPDALNSIWAEDGQNFLTDALTRPWYEAIATPFNGYFHIVARVCWAVVALFPLEWAAALSAVLAAVLTAALALAVHAAARSRLPGTSAAVVGVAAAVPMGFTPNTLAQLQFPLVHAGLWMLLWAPSVRWQRIVATVVPALAVLNSMLGVLLVPFALLRLARRRDRDSLTKVLALVPGSVLQVVPMLLGTTERGLGEQPDHNPVSVAAMYLRWGVPRSFLGQAWLAPPHLDTQTHRALVLAGLLIPAGLLALAVLRRTAPDWELAATLAGFAAVAGAVQLAAHGAPEDRYLVLVTLPNMAAAVSLVSPRTVNSGRTPLVVLTTLLCVVCAANLRVASPRDGIPAWDGLVAQARAECHAQHRLTQVTVHIAQWPAIGWQAVLPCDRLR
ncbi:hypothetical protein Drose_27525 [Dactylosporangium roseum]|uniref:Integral membrane protein-like protein n=1 Tax=Dactylosporangium roseum TaxID=47989 RepID=A0ABY5YZX0_9ACTN|nr:hypothetical protein [Dactylosporangium roseum]UWZ34906.1 hypothetical protein Drose_27525 [Dactylosporangium roseum]